MELHLIYLDNIFQLKFLSRSYSDELPQLYGGSTWWSLTRECVQYVVRVAETNQELFNRFRHCFCAEEMFFHTVIMNSEFRFQVMNNCQRYIDWRYQHGSCPAILDSKDYQALTRSDKLFARKFDSAWSDTLRKKIERVH